jgi:hypothetical protein
VKGVSGWRLAVGNTCAAWGSAGMVNGCEAEMLTTLKIWMLL